MEEETEIKEAVTMRVSAEFMEWVRKIQEEFIRKRGFKPSDSDTTTNIKRQFTGQFMV